MDKPRYRQFRPSAFFLLKLNVCKTKETDTIAFKKLLIDTVQMELFFFRLKTAIQNSMDDG